MTYLIIYASCTEICECSGVRNFSSDGKACSSQDECDFGSYCSQAGLCTAWLAAGSACDERFDVCDDGTCQAGKCVASPERKAFGAACKSDDECAGTGFCVTGKCAPPLACGSAALGQPCHYDSNCKAGLACDYASQRCVDPAAGLGKPCDPEAEETGCTDFAYCKWDPEKPAVCAARMEAGQACLYAGMSSGECLSGWCGEDGKCGRRPAACAQ